MSTGHLDIFFCKVCSGLCSFFFFLLNFLSFSYRGFFKKIILDTSSLSFMCMANIFSYSVVCFFSGFWETETLHFNIVLWTIINIFSYSFYDCLVKAVPIYFKFIHDWEDLMLAGLFLVYSSHYGIVLLTKGWR